MKSAPPSLTANVNESFVQWLENEDGRYTTRLLCRLSASCTVDPATRSCPVTSDSLPCTGALVIVVVSSSPS
eukprot:2068793-Prymnesium_polylepis.1